MPLSTKLRWKAKMIARLKKIAESLGMRTASSEGNLSDEMECGIWQFGDGMGITSIMSYPCGEIDDEANGEICPV